MYMGRATARRGRGLGTGSRWSVLWGGGVVTGGQAFETLSMFIPSPAARSDRERQGRRSWDFILAEALKGNGAGTEV